MNRKSFFAFDKLWKSQAAVLLLLVGMLTLSCAVNPVTGEKQIMLVSEDQEIRMGATYDPQVIATFGEYDAPELQAFIEEKGTEMGKISHRPELEYHFRILDSPVVNAFAVPGGYLYFTRGMLAQLNSEAELVGILGHEMGHVTARHSASQQSQAQLGQLALMGGMIASQEFAKYAQFAMQGMQLLFLKFSRDHERQSDQLGVEYASKLGYDAHQMADFFRVLDRMNMESDRGGVPTFLSTHPNPDDRYNAVHRQADRWQNNLDKEEWKVNRDRYLQMLDGMVYGDDPRQGYVENNIFYHPDLRFRFSYPSGWKLENSPLQVAIAPPNGKAIMVFSISRETSLDVAARESINGMGLTYVDGRNTRVNGLPARVVFSRQYPQNSYQSSRQPEPVAVISYFISYGDNIYVFHGACLESDFRSLRNSFESTMGSFGRLSDQSKINVQPERISIETVPRTAPLQDIFASFGVSRDKMSEMALLNNLELSERVRAGRLIKVVE